MYNVVYSIVYNVVCNILYPVVCNVVINIACVDPSVAEVDEGTSVQLTVRRLDGSKSGSVRYRTVNSTADSASDFVQVRGTGHLCGCIQGCVCNLRSIRLQKIVLQELCPYV